MTLIDSHCHIDSQQFDEDRDEVVARAREAGVAAMLNVGTGDPHSDDFRRAVAVAERYENVFASVGVHPEYTDAEEPDEDDEPPLVAPPPEEDDPDEVAVPLLVRGTA